MKHVPSLALSLLAAAALSPSLAAQGPTFTHHVAPAPLGQDAGEPSLGVNWRTGNVLYIAGLQTLRVTFDDSVSPAAATWTDVSYPLTSLITLDPILFTDSQTGRTFVSQLLGKASLAAYTDDDGATWTPSMGSGINSGVDHQTVGGGPFHSGLLGPLTSYPNAIYYCSQDIALAQCAVSQTGGLTFGPALPIYNLLQCGGLHGHIQVAPDGTAYVPNKGCGAQQAVSVSSNSGLTWTVRKVPGSTPGESDPAVGVATDGTVYFGFVDGNGRAKVAVSHNKGVSWSSLIDVGATFGIENAAFPAMVAGDPDRAAFAFLGTPTDGNGTAEEPTFQGEWHLYVAMTTNGGGSWTTVDTTPSDPVQRGSVCLAGTTCGSSRNLLDFMGITVDEEGRILVAYADGCIGGCVSGGPNSFTAIGTIARQSGGKRLFAAFD